jgi:S1-C subfamily serine protease
MGPIDGIDEMIGLPPRPTERSPIRLAFWAVALMLAMPAAADAASTDIVACYDAGRQLVTHVMASLCQGEVVSPEREAALASERRQRIAATVLHATTADPVTGQRRLIGTGSGFFVDQAGSLLTNNHVVDHCGMLTATPDDGGKIATSVVATSSGLDLALLRADRPAPAIARFSAAPEQSDGLHLAVVGYPAYGLPTRLSTMSPAQVEPLTLATSSPGLSFHGDVRHGNSGSPLLDQDGDVIGVVFATIDTPATFAKKHKLITGISYAISYHAVMWFLGKNGVMPTIAPAPPGSLTSEELHAKSRGFVAQIGCWK